MFNLLAFCSSFVSLLLIFVRVQVEIVQLNEETGRFTPKAMFEHPYPTTKIMWAPVKANLDQDLLATTGDYLRLWRVADDGVQQKALLNNVRIIFLVVLT
jgi:hypothetical protein